jgi:ribosomal protein S15P/S13E
MFLDYDHFAKKLDDLRKEFETELLVRQKQVWTAEERARMLDKRIIELSGHLETILVHAGSKMDAHEQHGTQRLDRLEAQVEGLSEKIREVCEHLQLPSEPRPRSQLRASPAPPAAVQSAAHTPSLVAATSPAANLAALQATASSASALPATASSASATQPYLFAAFPAATSPPAANPAALEATAPPSSAPLTSTAPAPFNHPGVHLVPSTPLNSQESVQTHLTLVKPNPVPPERRTTRSQTHQVNLPVPTEGTQHETRSRSRSRSAVPETLEVPGSPARHTRSRSASQSGTSVMDVDEPRRGHKRKGSNPKTDREERRQRK